MEKALKQIANYLGSIVGMLSGIRKELNEQTRIMQQSIDGEDDKTDEKEEG